MGLLESGELTGKYNSPNGEPKRSSSASPQNLKAAEEIMKLAKEIGHTPSQVAINWVRQQQARSQIIPIIGARKLSHLQDNLACLSFELTQEQLGSLGR